MIIGMETSSSGGGGTAYTVNIAHKAQNALTVYYSTGELAENTPSSYVEPSDNSFSATSYGGVFDETLVCSSSVSVRVHSSDSNNNYFLADVIVNGATVSADNHVVVPKLANQQGRLDLIYGVNFTFII